MATFQILRPFSGEREYRVGEVVELEGRNLARLVDQRYIAPVGAAEAPLAVAAEPALAPKKPRGRPKGSKNRAKPAPEPVVE